MFIANLMASVLALAMVGASTASLSKVESNSLGSGVVLNRDLHKAYYDSEDDYGTTAGYIYNYSSVDVVLTRSSNPDIVVSPGSSESYHAYYQINLDMGLVFFVNGGYRNRVITENYHRSTLDDEYIWVFDYDPNFCYYDASKVSTYPTDVNSLFNFSTGSICDEWNAEQYTGGYNGQYFYFSTAEGYDSDSGAWTADESIANAWLAAFESLDKYVDGVKTDEGFSASVLAEDDTYHVDWHYTGGAGHYIWLFNAGSAPVPYNPVDILGDIAGGLTGGIVPVAEGIGNGLQSLVQDIFLNADHDGLSVFGIVTICFAGLALALGLSRWVLNFVDTLGARDR